MSLPDGERIARLETQFLFLENMIKSVQTDTSEIKATLNQAKGGWKTLMLVGGVAGSIGAFLGQFIHFFQGR